MSHKYDVMVGVMEYAEELPVEIDCEKETGREIVRAYNDGGHNFTEVDLKKLLFWIAKNRPELLIGLCN